jgi:hypothetical protein
MHDVGARAARSLHLLTAIVFLLVLSQADSQKVSAQCGSNPIVCENQLQGNPESEWDISGAGDSSLQGFATDISVNKGETVNFKVNTTAAAFKIDIYRLGYYGGLGARKIASLGTFAGQQQDPCLTSASTGLVDCGNWFESASWSVPPTAVSGIYIARLVRSDTGGASHIVFIVRDDVTPADILFQTSDTTWQAYNQYGGNSLYVGSPAGRAYKVSYNRPFTTRGTASQDWLFNAEYPMVRWLEANGYYVSYFTGVDTDRYGASELLRHRAFLSVGHDEYWSGAQRTNVEAARAAGVHLAFFSGNEMFWKTRWEASIDGTGTPYRTLVSYKETHANAKIDPADPPTWTGTWRDPRFSPPADGGRPENAVTGTIFTVNCCVAGAAIKVPQSFATQPFWRNTRVATLPAGGSTTLTAGTLGYEWDENLNNGFRPAGLTPLSSTPLSVTQKLQDNGSTYAPGTATHALTLYHHSSGAIVFGAGTVQWSWGLDGDHDGGGSTPDLAMRQATANLFGDMGLAPGSLQSDLVPTPDTLPPTVAVTAPIAGTTVTGASVALTANATDNFGVVGVQFKLDGVNLGAEDTASPYGVTWDSTTATIGSHTLTAVARDAAGNTKTSTAVTVTVKGGVCPCSLWPATATPDYIETGDTSTVELGMRITADANGTISGVRFYKADGSSGPHVGHLWTNTGTLLGTATFSGETTSGWQQASFAAPIAVTANTTYVVSYYAPAGLYAADSNYFAAGLDNAPLHAPADGGPGANGVYRYGASGFPSDTYQATNYWVDVVFTPAAPSSDTTPPTVALTAPAAGATVSGNAVAVTATASDNVAVVGVQFKLDGVNLGAEDTVSPYGLTWNSTTATTGSHTLTAVARDAAGNTTTSTGVTVTVSNDATPPTISLTAPAAGTTVSGTTVAVTATASDNVAVVGVQFKLDGVNLGAEDTASPYSVTWNSTTATTGSHTLTAVARDAAGNTTTSSGVTVTVSNDATPPTISLTAPAAGTTVSGNAVAVTATASDNVAVVGVQFKLDGVNLGAEDTVSPYGLTWNSTTATTGSHTLTAVARDAAGNTTTSTGVTVTVNNASGGCPCSLWPATATPGHLETTDTSAVELGMRIKADADGTITGVRFYKAAGSAGPHVGHLWTNTGTLLGTISFSGETASGWQQATFTAPIAVTANTIYVVSYYAPAGQYAADNSYFATGLDNAPLHAPADGGAGANGVYRYGASGFPTSTYQATNYWVDGVFAPGAPPPPDTTPPTIALTAPAAGTTVSGNAVAVTATASDNVAVVGVQFKLDGVNLGAEDTASPYSLTWDSRTASNGSHTLTAVARDAAGNTTTASGVTVTVNNVSAGCPCSLWPATATPGHIETTDTSAVELGMRITADANGTISGVRFYKAAGSSGPHVGHLWTNTGTLLGTVTFGSETASGWQQASFAAPIAVTANTIYVVSYYAPGGLYAADNNYFATGLDNAPLHAPADGGAGANGVYRYGASGFPTSVYQATNYWVDVVLATAP